MIHPETAERLARYIERCSSTAYAEAQSEIHTNLAREAWERCKRVIGLEPPIKEIIPGLKNTILWDIGSGSGFAKEMFVADGLMPVGLSIIESECLDYYAGCGDMHNISLQISEHDPDRLVVRKPGAPIVWARHILEHSPIPGFLLQELHDNIILPRGWLYVEVPGSYEEGSRGGHEFNSNHYSVFGKTMWRSLIEKAGFEVVESFDMKFDTKAGAEIYLGFICRKS